MRKSKKMIRWSIESNFIGDKKRIPGEMIDEYYDLVQNPEDSMPWISLQQYEMGRKKATTDLASHLVELSMPVLIVNGEKDPAVPLKSAVNASKIIKNNHLHIMKGCKHLPHIERPEEFVQVLGTFLDNNNA
jgi:pimeloyl-ACP methyl ester carboxylesterase